MFTCVAINPVDNIFLRDQSDCVSYPARSAYEYRVFISILLRKNILSMKTINYTFIPEKKTVLFYFFCLQIVKFGNVVALEKLWMGKGK